MDQIRIPRIAALSAALRRGRSWYHRQVGRLRRSLPPVETISEATALADLAQGGAQRRWEAAAVLGKDTARSRAAVAALVRALADPEPFVRWQSVEALAVQEPGTIFPVLRALLADNHPLRRAGAANALGRMGGEAAGVVLRGALEDREPGVRAAAARGLGSCGDPSAAPLLLPRLSDPDVEVRCAAATSLGRIGSPRLAREVAEALLEPGQPLLVRRALAAALVHIPHPEIQPILFVALIDPDAQVRGYAADTLGQIGNEDASKALAEVQNDTGALLHGTVADAAIRALSQLDRRGRQTPPLPAEALGAGDREQDGDGVR